MAWKIQETHTGKTSRIEEVNQVAHGSISLEAQRVEIGKGRKAEDKKSAFCYF
jgi:hypothetical protein